MDQPSTVVIATRDRCASLAHTLDRLVCLPEAPEIIVVDNGSSDGTAWMVASHYPSVRLIGLERNLGGAARTLGVVNARSEMVAFCDDDSFWEPGSLACASRMLAAQPRLGVVAGRVLLGEAGRLDPICQEMQQSPLPPLPGLAHPRVLGFIACGAVARRSAYLQAGGFHPRFGIGGEEELLALDMAVRGWDLAYVPEVVARHFPSPVRNVARRQEIVTRNALWVSWLRDAPRDLVSTTQRAVDQARADLAARAGVRNAFAGLPWVVKERRRLPRRVQADRRLLARCS